MYLTRIGTNDKYELTSGKNEFQLGRHKTCDIQFESPHVSRFHCKLVRNQVANSDGFQFSVRAVAANNKTYVDNRTLLGPEGTAPLTPGSKIGLGVPFDRLNDQNANFIYLKLCCPTEVITNSSLVNEVDRHQNSRREDAPSTGTAIASGKSGVADVESFSNQENKASSATSSLEVSNKPSKVVENERASVKMPCVSGAGASTGVPENGYQQEQGAPNELGTQISKASTSSDVIVISDDEEVIIKMEGAGSQKHCNQSNMTDNPHKRKFDMPELPSSSKKVRLIEKGETLRSCLSRAHESVISNALLQVLSSQRKEQDQIVAPSTFVDDVQVIPSDETPPVQHTSNRLSGSLVSNQTVASSLVNNEVTEKITGEEEIMNVEDLPVVDSPMTTSKELGPLYSIKDKLVIERLSMKVRMLEEELRRKTEESSRQGSKQITPGSILTNSASSAVEKTVISESHSLNFAVNSTSQSSLTTDLEKVQDPLCSSSSDQRFSPHNPSESNEVLEKEHAPVAPLSNKVVASSAGSSVLGSPPKDSSASHLPEISDVFSLAPEPKTMPHSENSNLLPQSTNTNAASRPSGDPCASVTSKVPTSVVPCVPPSSKPDVKTGSEGGGLSITQVVEMFRKEVIRNERTCSVKLEKISPRVVKECLANSSSSSLTTGTTKATFGNNSASDSSCSAGDQSTVLLKDSKNGSSLSEIKNEGKVFTSEIDPTATTKTGGGKLNSISACPSLSERSRTPSLCDEAENHIVISDDSEEEITLKKRAVKRTIISSPTSESLDEFPVDVAESIPSPALENPSASCSSDPTKFSESKPVSHHEAQKQNLVNLKSSTSSANEVENLPAKEDSLSAKKDTEKVTKIFQVKELSSNENINSKHKISNSCHDEEREDHSIRGDGLFVQKRKQSFSDDAEAAQSNSSDKRKTNSPIEARSNTSATKGLKLEVKKEARLAKKETRAPSPPKVDMMEVDKDSDKLTPHVQKKDCRSLAKDSCSVKSLGDDLFSKKQDSALSNTPTSFSKSDVNFEVGPAKPKAAGKVPDFFLDDFSLDDDDLPDIDLPSACTSTPLVPHCKAPERLGNPIPFDSTSIHCAPSPSSSSITGSGTPVIDQSHSADKSSPCTTEEFHPPIRGEEPKTDVETVALNIKEEPNSEMLKPQLELNVKIKQEAPQDNEFSAVEEDDDDVLMVYSQIGECIYLSDEEEEMICSQENMSIAEESFGPIPSSPEPNLDDLFNKYSQIDDENNADLCDGAESIGQLAEATDEGKHKIDAPEKQTAQLEEDDMWFPVLSQNFYSDTVDEQGSLESSSEKSDEKQKSTLSASSSRATTSAAESDDKTVTLEKECKRSLSISKPKSFKTNQPRNAVCSSASPIAGEDIDGLSHIVQKARSKPTVERSMMLTNPIAPPLRKSKSHNREPSSSKTKSSRSTSFPKSAEQKKHTSKKEAKRTSPRKRRKSSDSLRDAFAKTYNVSLPSSSSSKNESKKAVSQHTSKTSLNSAPKENVSSSGASHARGSKDHRYDFKSVRASENISVAVGRSQSSEKPATVAAKFTRKNRSQKLTEVNLFPSPDVCASKTKSKATKIRKTDPKDIAPSHADNQATSENDRDNITENVSNDTSSVPTDAVAGLQEKLKSVNIQASAAQSSHSSDVEKSSMSSSLSKEPTDTGSLQAMETDQPELAAPLPAAVKIRNRLPGGILKFYPEKSKRKNRVTFPIRFEDLEKIRIISPRKDKEKVGPNNVNYRELSPKAPHSPNVSTNVHQFYLCSYYFVHKVCSWNYDWLKQYHENQSRGNTIKPPPLLSNKGLVFPTLILYECFKDYHEIFSVLLFYEIWESIYRDWLKFHQTVLWFKCEVDVVKVNHNPAPSLWMASQRCEGYNFTLIKLVTLINHVQEKQGLHPRTGSLIAIKVPIDNRSTVLFAYVTEHSRYNRTAVSKALKDNIPNATTTLALSVLASKGLATKILHGSILTVSNVSYLKPSIRLWDGLTQLQKNPLGPYVLKPEIECVAPPPILREYIIPEMPLNSSQHHSVCSVSSCVLNDGAPRISLIHGPPGTGKTRTLVALVAQIYRSARESNLKSRILLCAPSNAAVDELTRRLVGLASTGIKLRIVRNGFPGRQCCDRVIQSLSCESLVEKRLQQILSGPPDERSRLELERMAHTLSIARSEMMAETDPIRKKRCEDRVVELAKRKTQFERDCRQHFTPSEVAEMRFNVQREVLLSADVITSTLGSCCNETVSKVLNKEVSVCIVDEAGQCKESETWLPLLTGVRKLVLAGDHLQLPPTVLSQLAQGKNMKQSLFERIYYHIAIEQNKPNLVHSLNTQYRMHPTIALFPCQHFYKGELISHPSLEAANRSAFQPYVVFDMLDGREESGQVAGDMWNMGEAELLAALMQAALPALKERKVGVITPYQSQKHCLERHLSSFTKTLNIVINTIDGFQGQEKDVIFLSCVRGGGGGSGIGFLSQQQRLNVALTRARLSLVIVGSVSCLAAKDDAWKALLTDAHQRKKVVPVKGSSLRDPEFLKAKFLLR